MDNKEDILKNKVIQKIKEIEKKFNMVENAAIFEWIKEENRITISNLKMAIIDDSIDDINVINKLKKDLNEITEYHKELLLMNPEYMELSIYKIYSLY